MKPYVAPAALAGACLVFAGVLAFSARDRDGAAAGAGRNAALERPRPPHRAAGRSPRPAASSLVLGPKALLRGWLEAWPRADHEERSRLLDLIDARLDEGFGEVLLGFLADGVPECAAAVEVCGLLPFPAAAERVDALAHAGEPAVRAAAIPARDRFEAWTDEELAAFLEEPDERVVRAALAVAAERDRPPVLAVVRCLGRSSASVRAAALDALPERLDDEAAWKELLALARASDSGVRGAAVRALGFVEEHPGREDALLAALSCADWTVRAAALEALEARGLPLSHPEVVQARVLAPGAQLPERIAGLLALERTGTLDPAWLLATPKHWHPILRMHVARCLLAAGRPEGVSILRELLGTQEGGGVDEEDRFYVRHAARSILTEVAGRDLGPEPGDWRELDPGTVVTAPVRIRFRPRMNW